MLRVVHVIGPLRTGGAQTQLLGLVRAAHGRLWDATVVATSGGELSEEFQNLGCEFHELRRWGSPGLLRIRSLRKIVRDAEFDVVHGNLWQSNAYSRVAAVGTRHRPAVVISERNVEPHRSTPRRAADRLLAPITDAYVGNSAAVCEFIAANHPISSQPVINIPNAVDREVFTPSTRTREGPLRIGSVGRLDPEKGFDVLIAAVASLADAERDVTLEIVGVGPELEHLEQLAHTLPVRFLGSRPPGPPVAQFLRSLDVFVLPSTVREGRPNVVLEALSVGVPVVTTALDGMEEVIRGPVLVPPSDPVALREAIDAAGDDPRSWIVRSDPAPIQTFEGLAESYLEVFEAAISRR